MQKLVWKNSIGDEINLTSGNYGITEWEGFSNTSLNIQSQQVPFQDGGVFLDALMEQRELSVTLAMNDGGNLETRYRLRRELIHALNPKLGEGYLIYTNDFISKRIKCVAQIPLFETHNSNESGTPKASLTWVACEPYWEDLEQKSVSILSGGSFKVRNEGDVAISPTDIYVWGEGSNVSIKNLTNNTQLKINGAVKDINATLGMGQKDARLTKQYISFLAGGKTVETDYAQYTIASNCILKTSDFKTVENVKQFSSVSDITSDGKNIYVCDTTFIGMIKENGDYVERTDINADRIFYSKATQRIYYSSHTGGIYYLDSFDATPVFVKNTEYVVLCFADIGNEVFGCGAQGLLVNFTQDLVIPTNAGNKDLRCVAPYKNGYAVIGTGGFAQYNENGTWTDIPLNTNVILNQFCHNPYTDSYYFGGKSGFLAEIKSDNTKVVINTHTDGIVSYVFFSKIFETVQLEVDNGIAQIKNETELEIISQNNTSFACCKYVDFLGKYVAGSQDAIFTSSDFKVWEQVFSESGIGIFTHIESDNTHVILGVENSTDIYESSDGVNFTKKQSIVGKLWVTYNTEAEKFFFIGNFGNNEYWICSVDNLLSNNVTKIHQLDITNWYTDKTNSASVGDTTVFILAQENDADSILYFTIDVGATWSEKTSSCTYLKDLFSNSCIDTRIVNQKLLLTIIDVPSVFFVMWDSQQEDFIVPTFVTDENYLGFEANYVSDAPYICGYIENGEDSAKRCIVHLSVDGTTLTITKVLEAVSTDVSLYMSAFTVGNQLVYSYSGSNGSTYAYYNGVAHEGQIILKLKGYIAILIPNDGQDYWSICDDNFNEITRVSFNYLGKYFINIPNNNSIVTNNEDYAILTDAWQLLKVPSSVSDTVCLFNFSGNIYIADSHFIYAENYSQMWGDDSITVYDCKVSADNKLYVCTSNSYVRIVDDHFNTVQSIYVDPTFDKIYPLANGDIVGFAKSGDTKSIYKYDHNTEQTKKIYELTDQVTTFYDLGYFEKLNEVLLITNRGFLGIIDDYVTELLNPQYLTYAFVKNQQPRFVGVWGFKGTVDFTEGSSIINQVQDMTLKLEVGDNNLVFGYEGSSSMMLSLIYSPKYIGV